MTETAMDAAASARRPLLLGTGALGVLLAGSLAWGVFGSVSGAVIATGIVAVEGKNGVVEHRNGGTVAEVLVRDGTPVESGDLLLRFSDTLVRAEEAMLAAQHADLVARRNRLEAEFRGDAEIAWDEGLAAMVHTDTGVRDIVDGQRRVFEARAASRAALIAGMHERIEQARREIAGREAEAASIAEQSALIERELDAHRALMEVGLTRLDRLLALERAARGLEGRAGATAAEIARARSLIAELRIEIERVDARRVEQAEEQARDMAYQERQAFERLASARVRRAGTEVRAPIGGVVFALAVSGPQEVVLPGEPILEIVPQDARLVVAARVDPGDVDQVFAGQQAKLRFTAFPARATPELDGHVARVSADAVQDPRTGLSWYDVELAVGPSPGDAGVVLAGDLPVAPGMPVEVHIQTAKRNLASFLVKPVSDYFRRALREE